MFYFFFIINSSVDLLLKQIGSIKKILESLPGMSYNQLQGQGQGKTIFTSSQKAKKYILQYGCKKELKMCSQKLICVAFLGHLVHLLLCT